MQILHWKNNYTDIKLHNSCFPANSMLLKSRLGFPGSSASKESTCNARDTSSIPGSGRSPGEGHSDPLQYCWLENPHRQRSPVGYSPWGCKESDTTERLPLSWVWHDSVYNAVATLAYLHSDKSTHVKLKLQITQMTPMEGNLSEILYL